MTWSYNRSVRNVGTSRTAGIVDDSHRHSQLLGQYLSEIGRMTAKQLRSEILDRHS